MLQSRVKWPASLLAASVGLCLVSGLARAQTFDAPLVKCQSVTTPAVLTTCAASQDPLTRGGATISAQGDVTVIVFGAATNTTYNVSLVSNDGTQTLAIDSFMTDASGDGYLRKDAYFKFGTVGAGNVVLSSSGGEEFVTGILISSNGLESARDFQPGLVRATDVTVPGTLSNFRSDPLASGRVDVENDDGALSIHVNGARPATTYTAILRSPGASPTTTAIGPLSATDKHGDAKLVIDSEFAASTIGSGEVVLQSGSTDEFVSGFKVDQKFIPPKVSASNLEPCGSVTFPALSNCGSDPLDSGSYEVNATGGVKVTLAGANPSTNCSYYSGHSTIRVTPIRASRSRPNALGNAWTGFKSFSDFTKDTIASGTFVVKHKTDTLDQFVSGYEIH